MKDKLKNLAVRLLDDEEGITEEAYTALLDVLSDEIAVELNKCVEVAQGRFYLSEGHALQDWKQ